MRCPLCSAAHESRPLKCPATGLVVPATVENILTVRRLSPREVLTIGMLICDRWRDEGFALSDVRPRQITLDYDGVIGFVGEPGNRDDSEYVALRSLGGVLARCLDPDAPRSGSVASLLEGLAAAPPDISVALVRADFQQQLSSTPATDPLEAATWSDEEAAAPTVGIPAVDADANSSKGTVLGPTDATADPYADTYVRPRADLIPDSATDPTVNLSSVKIRDDSMASIRAGIPGPASDPLPTEVRVRPVEVPMRRRQPVVMLALAGAVVAVAVALAVVWIGR